MNGFNKIYAKSAVKSHSSFDLSRSHLTTLNIGQIIPLYNDEVVPGDSFSVNASYFARLEPLNKPTYGKMDFKTASFYVPYHQVAEDADAYFAGKTSWQGATPHLRFFYLRTILDMFVQSSSYTEGQLCGVDPTEPPKYDFRYRSSAGITMYGTFTPLGKYVYKFLCALGYNLPEDGTLQTTDTWYTSSKLGKGGMSISAFPLLATLKAWNDWMSQSQRYNTSFLSSLLLDIRQNRNISTYYDASTGCINTLCLYKLLTSVALCYENDYFTSAWQSSNAPLASLESVNSIEYPPYSGNIPEAISSTINGTKPYSNQLNQRTLDFLRSFDDWVRRNNYAGSRDVQQVYARFGIKSDEYRTHFAEVLGTSSSPIQIGDVTSTVFAEKNTEDIPLGSYAGKGIINADSNFRCKISDFGLIVTLGWISVRPMMPFGFDRKVLKNTPLDWFNPEFDAVGPQSISYMEVFENIKNDHLTHEDSGTIYGFTERYNEYKYGRDQITGDFRTRTEQETWHFARNLTDVRNGSQMYAQSTSMNTIAPDSSEFLRIFDDTTNLYDHFFITCLFNVNAKRPMLNLSQSARLGDGDTVIAKNGNTLN